MRILLLISALFFITFFSAEATKQVKRERYIDEVVFPTTRFSNNVSTLLQEGYRAFVIDTSTHIEDSALAQIDKFLQENPTQFIGFLQKETNHYNGDFLYSYFINKMIDVDRNYLPLCDSLLENGKQILFFSDRVEELKLASEDFLTYVELGKSFPLLNRLVFTRYESSNLFTVLTYNEKLKVKKPDSLLLNSNLTEASLNYFKKTGKIPNFILTDTPSELQDIYSKFPFYVKVSIVNQSGRPLKGVKFNGYEYVISEGVVHLYTDKIVKDSTYVFRENIALVPYKYGYRFVPEIFTFNYNNYNQYKTIHAQRIDLRKNLKLHLPLSKKELYDRDYPIEIINSDIEFHTDKFRKKTAAFNGTNSNIYISPGNVQEHEEAFSIALWAKPHKVSGNFPLFSKAGSYCLKIRESKLCLTIVDIADLTSDDCPIKANEWQHIALVYEKDKYISYYLNGVLTDMIPARNYKQSEKGFTIGTNQWDEYFEGEIADILFWDRPLGQDELMDICSTGLTPNKKKSLFLQLAYWITFIILVILALGVIWVRKKRKAKQAGKYGTQATKVLVAPGRRTEHRNYIRCFGGFAVFDQQGDNLAQRLSEKKLSFLLVVLYYTYLEGGISPQKLADIFWPGYNLHRAKNVRGTYIQDIRSVLSEEQMSIFYENKRWKVVLNNQMGIDLEAVFNFKKLISKINEPPFPVEYIGEFLNVVKNGVFADGIENEYVDSIKQEANTTVIEMLEYLLTQNDTLLNEKQLCCTCEALCVHDPLHEDAVRTKILLLEKQQKHHLALKLFDNFVITWGKVLGEPYQGTYSTFINDAD
ncbi:MAG: LamG domain-containing protein [Draconibacterium sp.]